MSAIHHYFWLITKIYNLNYRIRAGFSLYKGITQVTIRQSEFPLKKKKKKTKQNEKEK